MKNMNELNGMVAERLGVEKERVRFQWFQKNNGEERLGMIVMDEGKISAGPITYFEEVMEEVTNRNTTIEEAADLIVEKYKELVAAVPSIDHALFTSKKYMLQNATLQIVNYKMNSERLQGIVYRRIEDLAVVVRVKVNELKESVASYLVPRAVMNMAKIREGDLFKHAIENSMNEGIRIMTMEEAAGVPDGMFGESPFMVGTNRSKINGACILAMPEIVDKYIEENGPAYILPSSIHEVLFVKKSISDDVEMLKTMVMSVNRTAVERDEVLSDHVYVWECGKGLRIVA